MTSRPDHIDTTLLLRIKDGDERSLRILYDAYFPALLYFAESLIHNRIQAEDIVIVSFMKYWERRDNFSEPAAVRSFLYTVVRNSCYAFYNQLKKRDRRLQRAQEALLTNDDFVESQMVFAEMLQVIHREIEQLNPKYREVIQLLFVEDLSIQETASKTNISSVNVRKRKERAIELLRNKIVGNNLGSLALFYLVIGSKMP